MKYYTFGGLYVTLKAADEKEAMTKLNMILGENFECWEQDDTPYVVSDDKPVMG